jgi:carbamate kinase
MGPKVEAAMGFVERGGETAIITSLGKAADALEGLTGTHIVP